MKTLIIIFLLTIGTTTFNSSSTDNKTIAKDNSEISCFDSQVNNQEFSISETKCETGGAANKCCPYWDVEYSVSFGFWISVTCSTGGEFVCDSAACKKDQVSQA
jgi:hypothetical protein